MAISPAGTRDTVLGPLIQQYWSIVERIYETGVTGKLSNTAVQTVATQELSKRQNTATKPGGGANSAHITLAQGLAANNWS